MDRRFFVEQRRLLVHFRILAKVERRQCAWYRGPVNSRKPHWQTIFERFDPERPPERPEWRALRAGSPAAEIWESLERPFETPRVLLTGTIGSGKTTELYKLAAERAKREFVVFLDLERHFEETVGDRPALLNVSAWEVCFLVALSLLRAAEDRVGFKLAHEHRQALQNAWTALANATGESLAVPQSSAEFDVVSLARSMLVLASTAAPALGAAAGAVTIGLDIVKVAADGMKWTLPIGLGKRALSDQDPQMQMLIRCVNVIIGLVEHRLGGDVLVVIDGLDKIQEFDRAKQLFIDSKAIAQLDCRMIISGPFALRHHPALGDLKGFAHVKPLLNEPVMDEEDPSKQGKGVPFFCDLFHRRVADLDDGRFIPNDLLREIAYYSGGRARDFVTSVRVLAGHAWSADKPMADEALVQRTIDDLRRKRELGLRRGHIDVLKAVMADPLRSLPDGELAEQLLRYGALLPYPNGSEWFYPHPLLLMHMLRPRTTGSSP